MNEPQETTDRPVQTRPARPGDVCECGRPCVLWYLVDGGPDVPWCGSERPLEDPGRGDD